MNLGLAFLGGLVLNFMPCVLPVIGLKIMGIVQESQGSRRRVAWLNFWYVLGILSVVMGLGLATVIAKEFFSATFMWGEQFSSWGFRIGMLVLVFAMALSFLGVWEIPIPGFASGGASNKWMAQEGPIGAFSKGALTTVLATPCIGPFLGTALGVALSQPSWIVLLIFLFIGLGLSSPYILIAAFPRMMSWLPKPGPWMDTFKQLLAFPLLFTCIFLLSSISNDYRIATLTMLIGVWFACWWIGKVPAWAERSKYWTTLALATTVAVGLGVWSFRALGPVDKNDAHAINWVPYSEGELQKLLKQRKTVMIDFTADWCANCKTNLKTAIETEKVAKKIRDNRVVAMVADWTDFGPEIKQKLIELQSNGIPLLAVYPSTRPTEPILLRALLFESNVLDALQEAGPSQ
ncbi:MAG: protein-disulfide reductase DsbD family protein [Pirellulaceae bacterium]